MVLSAERNRSIRRDLYWRLQKPPHRLSKVGAIFILIALVFILLGELFWSNGSDHNSTGQQFNIHCFKSINKCLYVFTKLDIIFDFLDNAKKLKEDLTLKALNQLLRPFFTTSSFIKRLEKRTGQLKDSTI